MTVSSLAGWGGLLPTEGALPSPCCASSSMLASSACSAAMRHVCDTSGLTSHSAAGMRVSSRQGSTRRQQLNNNNSVLAQQQQLWACSAHELSQAHTSRAGQGVKLHQALVLPPTQSLVEPRGSHDYVNYATGRQKCQMLAPLRFVAHSMTISTHDRIALRCRHQRANLPHLR